VSANRISEQAIEMCIDIHSILVEAYGGDLHGSDRGALVSSHYLARIRNRLLDHEEPRCPVRFVVHFKNV
jgi:hypothetical protein